MKLIKTLLKFLGLLVLVLLIVSLFLPASSVVSRSLEINAPADKVFTYLNDFQQFNRWSPWFGIDPDAKYDYQGPEQGVGAKMSWQSDHPNVGSGSQEIVLSEPGKQVVTKLDFGGQGQGEASWTLEPAASGTLITWGFNTEWGFNPIGRYMGLMMDKWVGNEYEKGLTNLKALAESE